MTGPISDVTVLDLTNHITGPYATKLLGDFGANVIKVERPGGDLARRLGPFLDDQKHPERSGTFFFFNTNKRSIVIDLEREEGRSVLGRLMDRADVVVESFRPGVLDDLGVGWDFVHARKPSLPLVSISNFGQESPYRDYKGSELVLYGFAGEMYSMGVAEREPVKMYGTAALVQSGAAAATAIFGAVMVGRMQGVGQHVDFSIADSHLCGADRRHVSPIAFEFSGRRTPRAPAEARAVLAGVYPCQDGFVEFSAAGLRIDRLAAMLGNPDWLADPKWFRQAAFLDPDLAAEFEGHFYAWLMDHSKREIWSRARGARVLCGPLFTTEEIFEDPHFRDRGFWVTANHAEMGAVEMPGRPFIMGDTPWELRRPAPLLAEHTLEILEEAGYTDVEIRALVASGAVEAR